MKCNDFSGPERTLLRQGNLNCIGFLKEEYIYLNKFNLDNEWIIIINLKPFPTDKTPGKWLEVLNS